MSKAKSFGLVIFPDFETLDVYGVVGLIGTNLVQRFYDITLISDSKAEVIVPTSNIPTLASITMDQALNRSWDVIMLPGGIGYEKLIANQKFLTKMATLADKAPLVFTVCTGSLALAATGLLDGVHATTNKRRYCTWVPRFPKVKWVHQARWVKDGKYLSSSGVSAGMDAALYLLSIQYSRESALQVASAAEYIWNEDPTKDPFETPCEWEN